MKKSDTIVTEYVEFCLICGRCRGQNIRKRGEKDGSN